MGKDEIVKLTVAAVREYDQKQRVKDRQSRNDMKLRNTRLLLKHYNYFKNHVDKAIHSVSQIEALDVLDEIDGMNADTYIRTIKKSATFTRIVVSHVNAMLEIYESYAIRKGDAEQRKRRVLLAFYIDGDKISDISVRENVAERTCNRDLFDAINTMSALIFGIDSLYEMIE